MQINKINISSFGKFENKEIEFKKGLNLIFGCNEAGKSTIMTFIKAMLYQLNKNEEKLYIPWGKKEFGAVNSISYTLDNKQNYMVEKNFNRNTTSIYLTQPYQNITALFPVRRKEILYAEEQLGLNLAAFQSTVFIEQLGVRLQGKNYNELVERLVRLSMYGNENIDYNRAVKNLQDFKNDIGKGVTGKHKKLIQVNQTINDLHNEIEIASNNIKKGHNLQKEIIKLQTSCKVIQTEIDDLLWIKQYNSSIAMQHYDKLKNRLEQCQANKARLESNLLLYNRFNGLNDSVLEEIEKQYLLLKSLEKQKYDATSKKNTGGNRKVTGIILMLVSLIAAAISLGTLSFGKFNISSFLVLILVSCLGFGISLKYFVVSNDNKYENIESDIDKAKKNLSDKLSSVDINCITHEDIDLAVHELKNGYLTFKDIVRQLEGCERELNTLFESISVARKVFDHREQKDIYNYESHNKYQTLVYKYFQTDAIDAQKLDELLNNKREKLIELEKQVSSCSKEIELLANRYIHTGDLEEKLDAALREKEFYETTLEAIDIAQNFLQQALNEVQQNYSPLLNNKLNRIFGSITSNKYSELDTGTNLEVIIRDLHTGTLQAEQLSQGTVDQIYLSLRIALAELLSRNETLPLIIDEAFAQYDDERLVNTLNFLLDLSNDRQIIIFTCKKREIDIMRKQDVNIIIL